MLKEKNLASKKYFLFDIDGTLAIDDTIYDGSRELLDYIESIGGRAFYITNNSVKSRKDYIEKFKDFLSKEEVDLIVLHLLYDFTFKEIAKDKSTTVDVISSRYRRAILKVKQHYKGESL